MSLIRFLHVWRNGIAISIFAGGCYGAYEQASYKSDIYQIFGGAATYGVLAFYGAVVWPIFIPSVIIGIMGQSINSKMKEIKGMKIEKIKKSLNCKKDKDICKY
jgi:hypothetical protein